MESGPRSATLKSVLRDEQGCILIPEFEVESEEGATLDYDLRTKSEVDATRVKMRRFFELTADAKVDLERHFGSHGISGGAESGGDVKTVAEIVKRLEDKDFQVSEVISYCHS